MTTHASAAPNPLDEALTRLINRSVDAAESVAGDITNATGTTLDFLAAEIPDVIQQLLVWHAIESFIWFFLGLLLLASPWFVYWKWGGRGEPTGEADYGGGPRYKKTFTHNRLGEVDGDGDGMFALMLVGAAATTVGFLITMNNLEWLQILVAPKLYLLEYARVLLR
jgi:hypothetical protein